MKDPVYQHFLELSWRRNLTPGEERKLQAWLESHPEAIEVWEEEAGLNEALQSMPSPAVPSNFTSRVIAAVELESAAELRGNRARATPWWRKFVPRFALASLLGAAGFLSYQHFQAERIRAEVVSGLMTVSKVPSLPSPEILENFEAIRLSSAPAADEKLLTLLQ